MKSGVRCLAEIEIMHTNLNTHISIPWNNKLIMSWALALGNFSCNSIMASQMVSGVWPCWWVQINPNWWWIWLNFVRLPTSALYGTFWNHHLLNSILVHINRLAKFGNDLFVGQSCLPQASDLQFYVLKGSCFWTNKVLDDIDISENQTLLTGWFILIRHWVAKQGESEEQSTMPSPEKGLWVTHDEGPMMLNDRQKDLKQHGSPHGLCLAWCPPMTKTLSQCGSPHGLWYSKDEDATTCLLPPHCTPCPLTPFFGLLHTLVSKHSFSSRLSILTKWPAFKAHCWHSAYSYMLQVFFLGLRVYSGK